MNIHDRLQRARKEAGYTNASEAARAFGWTVSTYLGYENGDREPGKAMAQRIATAFGVSLNWLLTGRGTIREGSREVPIMGRIGAGARIEPDFEQAPPEGFETIESLVPIPPNAIGFEIVGDSMFPRYSEGDVIVCLRDGVPLDSVPDGEEAAVRTSDGLRYLKLIYREPGGFMLQSFNAPPIRGVNIEWISDVQMILRKSKWRRLNGDVRRKTRAK